MNTEVWSVILGAVAVAVTSLVKNPAWSDSVKMGVLSAVAIVFSVIQHVIEGTHFAFTGHFIQDLGTNAAVVFATATVIYKTYFQKTKLNTKLTEAQIPVLHE